MAPQPSGGEGTSPGKLSMAEVAFLAHQNWVQYPMDQSSLLPESALKPNAIIAIAVAWAESSGSPTVVSSTGDYGVWQINLKVWGKTLGLSAEQLKNPAINARAAYQIFKRSGWGAWTTYKTGAYLKFMPQAATAYAGRKSPGASAIGGMDPLQHEVSPVEAFARTLQGVNQFFTDLPHNVLRIGEFLGGAALIGMAIVMVSKKGVK